MSPHEHDACPPPRPPIGPSRAVVLVTMCVGYFLVLLDVTVVNVALPSIRTGLHPSVAGLQWVVDGYALALASLMLAGGTIGDLRGHRRVVLAGLAVFGLGSLGCGLAPAGRESAASRWPPVRCWEARWSRPSAGARCSWSTCRSSSAHCSWQRGS